MPSILAAEKALKVWLSERVPAVAQHYRPEVLNAIRSDLQNHFPEQVADVSWFRLELLRRLFTQAGVPGDLLDSLVEEAFAVFIKERCAVTLYGDSEAALRSLASDYRLVAITNGNSDVFATPVGKLFEFSLSPVQPEFNGIAKPDAAIFERAAERLELGASEILHIGDCPTADVAGANAVGWLSALMWRPDQANSEPDAHGADVVLRSMTELRELLQH